MRITWNLRMLCAEKGIWSGMELGRKLHNTLGLELSAQTLSNLMKRTPKSLSLNIILALCTALECSPNDLLLVDTTFTRRTTKKLVEDILKVNQARTPRKPQEGRKRKRKVSIPPKTRI